MILWITGFECCPSWLFHFHHWDHSFYPISPVAALSRQYSVQTGGPRHHGVVSNWGFGKRFFPSQENKRIAQTSCGLCFLPVSSQWPFSWEQKQGLSVFSRNLGWKFCGSHSSNIRHFPLISFLLRSPDWICRGCCVFQPEK